MYAIRSYYDAVFIIGFVNAEQHTVAEAGGFARPRPALNENPNPWRRPVRFLVPFVGRGDEIAFGSYNFV